VVRCECCEHCGFFCVGIVDGTEDCFHNVGHCNTITVMNVSVRTWDVISSTHAHTHTQNQKQKTTNGKREVFLLFKAVMVHIDTYTFQQRFKKNSKGTG
jgi:hypothetical protein